MAAARYQGRPQDPHGRGKQGPAKAPVDFLPHIEAIPADPNPVTLKVRPPGRPFTFTTSMDYFLIRIYKWIKQYLRPSLCISLK